MLSPVLIVTLFGIFIFVVGAGLSIGLRMPEKILLAVMALGGGMLTLGMRFYGTPIGPEILSPAKRWWLSFAGGGNLDPVSSGTASVRTMPPAHMARE